MDKVLVSLQFALHNNGVKDDDKDWHKARAWGKSTIKINQHTCEVMNRQLARPTGKAFSRVLQVSQHRILPKIFASTMKTKKAKMHEHSHATRFIHDFPLFFAAFLSFSLAGLDLPFFFQLLLIRGGGYTKGDDSKAAIFLLSLRTLHRHLLFFLLIAL